MSSCIITPNPGSGLLSLFNVVVTCLSKYDKVAVNWITHETLYTKDKIPNLWDAIAHPIHEIFKEDNPTQVDLDLTYTFVNTGYWYLRDNGWRDTLHNAFNKITLKEKIYELISQECDKDQLKDCIAIVHRSSNSIAAEQITKQNPSIESILRAANRISRKSPIFLVCDTVKNYNIFQEEFGSRLVSFKSIDRSDTYGETHFEKSLGISHVQLMMSQTIALSKCKHLVHAVSNIATSALYINPEMTNTFLQG
jgi:hypothetical protein